MVTYKAIIDDFEIALSRRDLQDINLAQLNGKHYHLIHDHNSKMIYLDSVDLIKKKIKLFIDEKPFEIRIENPLDLKIKDMGLQSSESQQLQHLKAPMPGLVLDVMVIPDQEVNIGDPLLILEAMKMENIIKAPRNGMIKAVHVSKGASVDKGAILIEIE